MKRGPETRRGVEAVHWTDDERVWWMAGERGKEATDIWAAWQAALARAKDDRREVAERAARYVVKRNRPHTIDGDRRLVEDAVAYALASAEPRPTDAERATPVEAHWSMGAESRGTLQAAAREGFRILPMGRVNEGEMRAAHACVMAADFARDLCAFQGPVPYAAHASFHRMTNALDRLSETLAAERGDEVIVPGRPFGESPPYIVRADLPAPEPKPIDAERLRDAFTEAAREWCAFDTGRAYASKMREAYDAWLAAERGEGGDDAEK